jgi:lipopolysaccharide/colanic/teichoic acid biosynthesis glycosyltransferase
VVPAHAGVKVCFFNRSYWPDVRATGQLLTELAEDLVRCYGARVSVVAGLPPEGRADDRSGRFTGGWPVRREARNGVHIHRARGTRFASIRAWARLANYLSYFASACLAGLGLPRQDVIVTLTDPPIIGLAAYAAARRSGARFVFLCQDVFPEVTRLLDDFRSPLVDRCLDRINRFLLTRADVVIALGERMRERLIAKGAPPERVRVIHNWADGSAIVPGPKENAFSLEHGLADKFVVMHSGNVGLSQELDALLDAAALLRPHPEIVITIVGDGTRRAALEKRARSERLTNVRFLPYQPKARLRESFATADVFVVSLQEGLGGSIVPSKLYGILAAGRPYVAAVEEACEVTDITTRFDCGLLAEPGKPRDLADKILELYRDRPLAARLGANGRHASQDFDRTRQIARYHDVLSEVPAVPVRREPPLPKRVFDVVLAGAGLLLSAPLWALIAMAITIDDRGPVFYRQARVGRGGRRFTGLKFRSMIVDSDARFGPLQKRDEDARITRVGRRLRATAMDELPQLWNIVRGDMSFVGPRALMPEEIEVGSAGETVPIEKVPGYEARHAVVPGLTGLAQIYADRDVPRRHKFRYDRLYIARRSFCLDLRLILLSFWITFRGTWERRGRKF